MTPTLAAVLVVVEAALAYRDTTALNWIGLMDALDALPPDWKATLERGLVTPERLDALIRAVGSVVGRDYRALWELAEDINRLHEALGPFLPSADDVRGILSGEGT